MPQIAAGPSHGSITALQYANIASCAGFMRPEPGTDGIAAGTSRALAMGASRPAKVSSSNTLSRVAVSEPPTWITGLMSSMNGSSAGSASRVSWLRIQLVLPDTVLISPLWASLRNGCASFQVGKVLVE